VGRLTVAELSSYAKQQLLNLYRRLPDDATEEERAQEAQRYVTALQAALAKTPAEWFDEEEAAKRLRPGANREIRTISAGLPSLGKRRKYGGTPLGLQHL
jgi:hypothetical protein